ncbi:uncharacterized protein L969DRAFT_86698 [Mixia osmundae IAM 14324]|nr:uncharacterized protein L969DRAFT_86698 [Mixia osmundae IAM 14324]KEI40079.1 hypothetical protein L969DRAFT_86698 [Mixia osmundae IAM 14324]
MKASPDVLKSICSTLDVPLESIAAELGEGFVPMRGTCKMPPTDPTIYRLYEALTVYGHPLKQIIYEKFGDGIMSAIAFRCKVEKIEEESGTRVQITFNGKWLPYAWK